MTKVQQRLNLLANSRERRKEMILSCCNTNKRFCRINPTDWQDDQIEQYRQDTEKLVLKRQNLSDNSKVSDEDIDWVDDVINKRFVKQNKMYGYLTPAAVKWDAETYLRINRRKTCLTRAYSLVWFKKCVKEFEQNK